MIVLFLLFKTIMSYRCILILFTKQLPTESHDLEINLFFFLIKQHGTYQVVIIIIIINVSYLKIKEREKTVL